MKNLLMVCHDFPPLMVGGVIRPLKFAKYLPQFGWRPIVLTADDGGLGTRDESLLGDLPAEALVIRTPPYLPTWLRERARAADVQAGTGTPRSSMGLGLRLKVALLDAVRMHVFVPDRAIFWKHGALRAARRARAEHGADAIYSTAPPNSAHLIAMALKNKTGLPWVADFRDHWIGNPSFYRHLKNPLRRMRETRLEKDIVKSADAVVSATDAATREFQQRYPEHSPKFLTIWNGYDEDDFSGAEAVEADRDYFRVRSFGSVGKGRRVDTLLEGLARFSERHPEAPLQVEFFGAFGHDRAAWTARLGDKVSFIPHVPHGNIGVEMRRAALLLVVQGGGSVEGSARFAVPGKLYEYGRSGVPLLGLVELGPTRAIIEEYGLGRCCNFGEADKADAIVEAAYQRWRGGSPHRTQGVRGAFSRFDRRSLTEELAVLLNTLTEKTS